MANNKPENIRLSDDGTAVVIIDQTLLPKETKFLELSNPAELHEAIKMLRVRGAPAIGIFAAYALYVIALNLDANDYNTFLTELRKQSDYLDSARPTAVNLSKQLQRMMKLVEDSSQLPLSHIRDAMGAEASKIQQEDIDMCLSISEYGLSLIENGNGVLTHCNAGPLATSMYGTGLGPILLANERGINLHAYVCETRPLLQGARLTSYELSRAGVACTLICDNMTSIVMKEGKIDAVFVGCDRVALNGDTANKIGTSGVAILAKYYGIPFYVCCPSSTIDPNCETGADITIELRDPNEIKELYFKDPIAPDEVPCYNPSFDVTDHSLITAIITETGINWLN
ncbi:MAG: S-methyl-5-thioribose-1-phosphate isomerase [Oscillospiraceae bacterium]|nr:S-methyl-5-thioribose-1-phosphate isomerase [Oscillospiraceae bacterium]